MILDDQLDGQMRDDYSYGEPLTSTGNRAYYFNYGDLHFVNKPNKTKLRFVKLMMLISWPSR